MYYVTTNGAILETHGRPNSMDGYAEASRAYWICVAHEKRNGRDGAGYTVNRGPGIGQEGNAVEPLPWPRLGLPRWAVDALTYGAAATRGEQ